MNISRDKRKQLDALSKDIFGSSSRWQKFVSDGYTELLTQEVEETVPGENGEPDTAKKVTAPILREDGAHQSVTRYHTVESVEEFMNNLKKQRDDIMAMIAKQQQEQKAQKAQQDAAEQIQKEAGGSVL